MEPTNQSDAPQQEGGSPAFSHLFLVFYIIPGQTPGTNLSVKNIDASRAGTKQTKRFVDYSNSKMLMKPVS